MREVKEAEFWLNAAKELLKNPVLDREKFTVIVAQSIHSIIRANDALTLNFLNKRATRHDDAQKLFLDLVRLNKIPSRYAELRKVVLLPAIMTKSKADYKGLNANRKDAEKWINLAERFLNAVKECLNE